MHHHVWLGLAQLLYGLLVHTAPVTSFGNPGAMLHRAASSGHGRNDSFGTVGMCCHRPAVFSSFLNHLKTWTRSWHKPRNPRRTLGVAYLRVVPPFFDDPYKSATKKLSNDPPKSEQESHSSNLHQEVRAERGFLQNICPSILWCSLN